MVAERRQATPRVGTLESLRGQAQDRQQQQLQQQQNCELTWGHHSRTGSTSSAVETRNDIRRTTAESRSERDGQWQNRHVEQHEHSTAESISKANWFQAIPTQ